MESIAPYGNVQTGPRQGQGPGPDVFYCASPIPCICSSLVLMQCDYTITKLSFTMLCCQLCLFTYKLGFLFDIIHFLTSNIYVAVKT